MSLHSSFFLSIVLLSSISLHASEGRKIIKKHDLSHKHDEHIFREYKVSAKCPVVKQSEIRKDLSAAIIRGDKRAIKGILNADNRRSGAASKGLATATINGIPVLHYPISKDDFDLVAFFVETYNVPVNQEAIDCATKTGRTAIVAYLQAQITAQS